VELVQARQGGVSFAVENSTRMSELLRNVDRSVQVRVEEDRAVIGLVGEGVGSTPSLMARALHALQTIDVRMNGQGSSLFMLCFVVPDGELRRSVESLHREFFSAVDPEIFVSARESVEITPAIPHLRISRRIEKRSHSLRWHPTGRCVIPHLGM